MKMSYIKNGILRKSRAFFEFRAKEKLKENIGLWEELNSYISKSGSTGCSFSDYFVLYSFVKKEKPIEIFECSTGVSTVVMAYALMEKELGILGRITSVEESVEYYTSACQLLPEKFKKYVEILQRPKVEGYYNFFRGVRYQNKPDRDYDFVFIDGPTTSAPSDGQKTFDFDFVDIVSKTKKPVQAIIDCRKTTFLVLSKILGKNKLRWDPIRSIGYIKPCIQSDLKTINDIVSKNF